MLERKKRPILCWQMVVLVVMLLSVFVSSFLVRIRIDESDLAEVSKSINEKMEDLSGVKAALTDIYGMEEQDKENYITNVKEKLVNYVVLAELISDAGMKSEFSFTGWEIIFLTEPMIAERMVRVVETSKGLEGDEMETVINQIRSGDEINFGKINEFFGHMRMGYFLLYMASLALIIMTIILYVKKCDGRALVIANLLVSIGGVVVTVFGMRSIGRHGVKLLEWAVVRTTIPVLSTLAGGSTVTSPAGAFTGTLVDFEKPLQDFGAAITSTLGNTICTSACIVMLLFAVYMMIDHFILAKKRELPN